MTKIRSRHSPTRKNHIRFNPKGTGAPQVEGLVSWNPAENTLDVVTGKGPVLQLGQEQYLKAINNTGSQINDGSVVIIDGSNGIRPTVSLAKADNPVTSDRVIGVATQDIVNGSTGFITTFGLVRGINTDGLNSGDTIYLSADTAGVFTTTRPSYPNYLIQLGNVVMSDANTGSIFVSVIGTVRDIIENGWNGSILETIKFTVTESGGVITGNLEQDGGGDITLSFSDGFTRLDCTDPQCTVTLTAGSDDVPTENFIYILQSDKTQMVVSTTDWPDTEHIRVAKAVLRTAATTATDGALGNRNWNDHIAGTNLQGHILHIGERMRKEQAKWDSGTQGSLTINADAGAADDVFVAVTSGMVYQLHNQSFPALDMETGDDIHVVNDPVNPYQTISNLNSELVDANNDSLVNRSFNFVVWGIQNRTGETSHLMLNLPDGSYTSSASAITDALKTSIYTIPSDFEGTGFLIARFTISHSNANNGTWTLQNTEDLRGQVSSIIAGGGTTSVITDFSDNQFSIFNVADNTKIVNFDASGITTATTRTMTIPDEDGTLITSATTNYATLTDGSDADALHTHTGANLTDDIFVLIAGDTMTGTLDMNFSATDPGSAAKGIDTVASISFTDDSAIDGYAVEGSGLFSVSSGKTASGKVVGFFGVGQNNGPGTITDVAGMWYEVRNVGGGTTTNAYGVYVDVANTSGTTVNGYGVYINGVDGNNQWGVYQVEADDNYLEGDLGIGTNAPEGALHISKTGNIQPIIQSSDNNAVQLILKTTSTNRRIIAKDGSDNVETQIALGDNGKVEFIGPTAAQTPVTFDGGALDDSLILTSTEFTVNEKGADMDFRIEGDNDTHLFFIDAGTDNIRMGTDGSTVPDSVKIAMADDVAGVASFAFVNLDDDAGSRVFNNFMMTGTDNVSSGAAVLVAGVEQQWTSTASTRDGYFAIRVRLNNSAGERVRVTSAGNVGIGASSPLGKLEVRQGSTTAAIPTLYLNQSDISEEFIFFNSTAGTGNAIEAVGGKSMTITHWLKVEVNGSVRYLQVGTIA